jgi:hypothetical protein
VYCGARGPKFAGEELADQGVAGVIGDNEFDCKHVFRSADDPGADISYLVHGQGDLGFPPRLGCLYPGAGN